MITNYFKVVGTALGRPQHCFPFDGLNKASQNRAWEEAKELQDRHPKSRIVSFLPSLKTPLQVGVNYSSGLPEDFS
jgi:hypothetical protein